MEKTEPVAAAEVADTIAVPVTPITIPRKPIVDYARAGLADL
jgi:hypothetical protein